MGSNELRGESEKSEILFSSDSVVTITEQKRLKEFLCKSEEKYRSLIESGGAGVATTDLRGRFTFVNKTLCRMIGYSEEELIGRPFVNFLHPDDKKGILKIFLGAWKHPNRKPRFEFRAIHKKGHVVHMFSAPTLSKSGNKITGFNAIIIDITECKLLEEVLRGSEEKFRNIFENAFDCLIYLDRFGRILDVNRRAVETFGGSKKELLGKQFTKVSVLSPKDIPRLATAFAKGLAGGTPTLNLRIKNKKGQKICLECSGALIRADNKVSALVIARDVTERKRAEEEIQENQQKFERLFMGNPEAAFYADKEWRILDINPRFTELFGYTLDEIKGKGPAEVIVPKDRLKEAEMLGKKTKEGYTYYDTVRRKKDGSLVPVSISAAPITIDGQMIGHVTLYKDITQHKRAEETVLREKKFSDALIKSSVDGILAFDSECRYTVWNPAMEGISGIRKEQAIGKCAFDVLPFLKKTGEDKFFYDALAGKTAVATDRPYSVPETGKQGFFEGYYTPIRNEKSEIIGGLAVIHEITERKKAESTLQESEEKYRNLFENARDIILTVDPLGKVTSLNKAIEKYGWKKEEIMGKNMLRLMPKKSWPSLLLGMTQIKEGRLLEGEIELITPKGKVIAEYKSNSITKNGKIVGVQVIGRDITERKKMEEELKQYSEHLEELVQKKTDELLESERRYSVVIEEANDGVTILQDGKTIFVNNKGAEIIGYSKDELVGVPFEKVLSDKYRELTKKIHEKRLRGEKTPATYETELVAKTGEPVPVEVSGTIIQYKGRPATLGIVRDIRERKQMEEQRRRLEKLAALGELATMVAHDLRNPLTSIRNASYFIRNKCPHQGDSKCHVYDMLNIIEQETLFANDIINDLLDFATRRPLQTNRQNINTIVEHSLTKNKISETIRVERNFAKNLIAIVDEKQLERVFLNIIKNAVQAMPHGGKLTATTNETKDHIEIEFKDTGIGIPKENMSKVFQPLFTTKAKGIGMGLAICKRIVDEHDGTVDVKSEVGKGTSFIIKLPKKEESNR